MSIRPFNPADIVITRRELPPDVVYTCPLCKRERRHSFRWPSEQTMDDPRRASGRIVCRYCVAHWGTKLGLQFSRATRGDRRLYQRLSALQSALQWEAHNAAWS